MAMWADEALRDAAPAVFWTDRPDAPAPTDRLRAATHVDLLIIGGGFTGLWAAVQALEDDPGRSVLIIEADTCGFGASTRNGGFCDASLTHGLHNGLQHWPEEMTTLHRLGNENLDGIEAAVEQYRIDADFRRTAEIDVALQPWQLEDLAEGIGDYQDHGEDVELLDAEAVRSHLDSPLFLGGMIRRSGIALLDPGRMTWELRRVALELGARLHEFTPAEAIRRHGNRVWVETPRTTIDADHVLVATNAFAQPIKKVRRHVIPIWDHVLMTEPLSSTQQEAIGWQGREGVGENANQFHYFRMTEDDRILWGGYDANYHFGGKVDWRHEQNDATHSLLARQFFDTFPQLEGLRFTHRWGGPIGTTSKFAVTFGTSHGGRVAWAAGYTGLGVGASRFGARVGLDLLDGASNERTDLTIVKKKPFPFPPEPLRWPVIQVTRNAIHRADDNGGERGLWLGLLDRFGIGFDS